MIAAIIRVDRFDRCRLLSAPHQQDRRTVQRVVQQTEHGSSSAMKLLLRLVQSKE
jgi:hypothetical protein